MQGEIIVTLYETGRIEVKSNLDHQVRELGLLELAKQAILDSTKSEKQGMVLTVPEFSGLPMKKA